MKSTGIYIVFFLFFLWGCGPGNNGPMDLSGQWYFQTDPNDVGVTEKWFSKDLEETIILPGSMNTNGKGNDVSLKTKWTGQVVDKSWYESEKYEKYRKPGNIKIPFWLQPEKKYTGAAWYQKKVDVDKSLIGKHVVLQLERCHWETEVWINGKKAGMENSLSTPHRYILDDFINAGENTLSIKVDNRIKDIEVGLNAHSVTDHTQSNWNGIVGAIELNSAPAIYIENISVVPNVEERKAEFSIRIGNLQKTDVDYKVSLKAESYNSEKKHVVEKIVESKGGILKTALNMGDEMLLWDEYNPNMYRLTVTLKSDAGTDQMQTTFGMREIKVEGTRFLVNNRPVFLRGTLESSIFPLTGYPSTNVKDWEHIYQVCKEHGLNHVRFHSYCPPEAAFIAADNMGIYLQAECAAWTKVGSGSKTDKWLFDEGDKILNEYGNHPSFCFMAYGNEPGGNGQVEYLNNFVAHFKKKDSRRLYTGAAGLPSLKENQYFNNAAPRIQGWGAGLNSIINSKPPQTRFDFKKLIDENVIPYVSHEIGQWCVYPNFKEIEKYTGVLKARNFEIFQETLNENNLGDLAEQYLLASGKLQALCYKADIEAALRTPGFAGFQLLDLHDFPGQGTALVGVLDAFWEEKGYVSPQEFKQFCNETVPLARMDKRVFYNNEDFFANIEVSHAGEAIINNPKVHWEIVSTTSETLASGSFNIDEITIDNAQPLGKVEFSLSEIKHPQQLHLTVQVNEFQNGWDFWVYPSVKPEIKEGIYVTSEFDGKARKLLKHGKDVLLTLKKNSLSPKYGGDIKVGFSSIFWNTAWTRGQAPHTLGILCDPEHPALSEFPTEYHSNWQWWDAMSHSNAIILDGFDNELAPLVRVIDDWFENRNLALLFEVKVGDGKLLVSGIDFLTNIEDRAEARQLLYSLKKYMNSDAFDPQISVSEEQIIALHN